MNDLSIDTFKKNMNLVEIEENELFMGFVYDLKRKKNSWAKINGVHISYFYITAIAGIQAFYEIITPFCKMEIYDSEVYIGSKTIKTIFEDILRETALINAESGFLFNKFDGEQ